jgi:hypothetical protein
MTNWNLGRRTDGPHLVSPVPRATGDPYDPVYEVFEVTQYERGVVVRARRTKDLVDFTLTLTGYACIGIGDSVQRFPRLARRSDAPQKLMILLPPQHIAEQIREPRPPSPCQAAASWGPSRVRMSSRTRLVFDVPREAGWQPRLRISELTNWAKLRLRVHPRANAAIGLQVERQLERTFGEDADYSAIGLEAAIAKIRASLQGPLEDESALELASRLILSPSDGSAWLVPDPDLRSDRLPLWSTRLSPGARKSVRAIWSARMKPGTIPSGFDEPPADSEMLSLSFADHWEIVAQTSVYGLPALRRFAEDEGSTSRRDSEMGAEGEQAPRSRVVRPDFPVTYLQEIDTAHGYVNKDSGIAVASPFDDADISLTALGGVVAAEWKGEPPRLRPSEGEHAKVFTGFNLERLSFRSWLGRDSRVVAVRKGFLFPLGIRVSLISLHERHIYPNARGEPVSYLIRREFIVCPRRPRPYPGPYHPYQGRDFPAASVTMQTLATPDLAPGRRIEELDVEHNGIFWPLVFDPATGRPTDFVFEWATPDAPAVRSRLIFVANSMASKPRVMEALVRYYNEQASQERRMAQFGGIRHRYAAPLKEGDTSFDTINWLLGARGRRIGADAEESFDMDGRMEGADQPPFYPFMSRGLVSIQSLDQMMGAPQGPVAVEFFQDYLDHEFGTEHPHGIYLKLSEPVLNLSASSRKNRSGGLASPDLNVGAISRRIGLVGGEKKQGASVTAASSPLDFEIDFSDAAEGKFNPAKFFAGAKLLGIVPLEDLLTKGLGLDTAPALKEHVEYGAREAFRLVQEAAARARETLYRPGNPGESPVTKMRRAIAEAEATFRNATDTDYGFGDIYPSLVAALEKVLGGELEALLARLEAAAGPEEAREPISGAFAIGRELLQVIATLLKDPVPDSFEQVFAQLQDFFAGLFESATERLADFGRAVEPLFTEWLKAAFCEAIDRDGFGRILFGDSGTGGCEALFSDPHRALPAFRDGLYASAFEAALGTVGGFIAQVDALAARVKIEAERVRSAVIAGADGAIGVIEARLEELDPTDDEDIRAVARQARLAQDIVADLEAILSPPVPPPSNLGEALAHGRKLAERSAREARHRIGARLKDLEIGIRAAPGHDPKELLKELEAVLAAEFERTIVAPVDARVKAMRDRLANAFDEASRKGLSALLSKVEAVFAALLGCEEVAAIARAGRGAEAICTRVRAAALALFDGIMAPADAIRGEAEAVTAAAARISVPTGGTGCRLRKAINLLTAAANAVVAQNEKLRMERSRIAGATASLCAQPRLYLDPITEIVRLRRSIGTALRSVAVQAERIERLIGGQEGAGARPDPHDQEALEEIVRGSARAYAAMLGTAGIAALKDRVDDALEAIANRLPEERFDAYRSRLLGAWQELQHKADELADRLDDVLDPAELRALAEAEVEELQSWLDRKLAASLLQSVGFTDAILGEVTAAVEAAVKPLARALVPFYETADRLLTLILSYYPADPFLQAVFDFALGGRQRLDALRAAGAALAAEKDEVGALAQDPDLTKAAEIVGRYRQGEGGLALVLTSLNRLALTNIGHNLTEALREQLKQLESELRALLAQFVPTRLETRYRWATRLNQFPTGDNWIFRIKPAEAGDPPDPGGDLVIDSRFSFDVLTKSHHVEIQGTLRPFQIQLIGAWKMATVTFEQSTFRSVNGSEPSFSIKVAEVEIGPFLKYIQSLQQWLSPQGSGFYLKPTAGFGGIEAGYVYDAGIVQVGSLQFINVAFRVAAILPFSKDSDGEQHATFIFGLASPARPFLISNPPYGGGGWIELRADARKVTYMDVALVFGGVAAIKFGPLDAQGRIVAGVRVTGTRTKAGMFYTFVAIFEAVGEGSIACFSISVSLRVTLTQQSDGALYGQTEYSFKFKVGFASFRYRVTARYRLNNKKGSSLLESARLDEEDFAYLTTDVPPKASRWGAYRTRVALDLLEAA